MPKKNISIDTAESLAITGAATALTVHVFDVIERVKSARANGNKVPPAQVRELILKALGIPTTIPEGPVEQLVTTVVDALKD